MNLIFSRYKRLTELLSKSKFYSEFLMKKMQDEDEASKLKEQKLSDRKKIKEEEEEAKKAPVTKAKGRGRKRKAGQVKLRCLNINKLANVTMILSLRLLTTAPPPTTRSRSPRS